MCGVFGVRISESASPQGPTRGKCWFMQEGGIFFGLKILILDCVGLQIPRDRDGFPAYAVIPHGEQKGDYDRSPPLRGGGVVLQGGGNGRSCEDAP